MPDTIAYKFISRLFLAVSTEKLVSQFNRLYFLILSNVEKLCNLKPNASRLSSYLIHWNISDASLGTEELAHLEMVATIVHQLTRDMTMEEIEKAGFQAYFVDHTAGVYPQAAAGFPFDALCLASKGDAITDLSENMAAEQKARTTYDNIIRMCDDPDVLDPIRFLREREVVHYQRFGEALRLVQDDLNSKNFYAINPEFDL